MLATLAGTAGMIALLEACEAALKLNESDVYAWTTLGTALADMDLFDHCQRLQIEHGDSLVAAVRREAVPRLRVDPRAVHARRIRNVAEHLPGGPFDDHHVRGPRHEHAARGGFHRDVVGAALAFAYQVFRSPRMGPGGAVVRSLGETWSTIVMTVKGIGLLFRGVNLRSAVMGPLGIMQLIGSASTSSLVMGVGAGAVTKILA